MAAIGKSCRISGRCDIMLTSFGEMSCTAPTRPATKSSLTLAAISWAVASLSGTWSVHDWIVSCGIRRTALRALFPTGYHTSAACSRASPSPMRIRLALNEPASPLSAVIRIAPVGTPALPGFMNGWSIEPTFASRSCSIAANASAYGRDCFCSASARRILAAATCFIALVICSVFFIDRIRSRRSRTEGIRSSC